MCFFFFQQNKKNNVYPCKLQFYYKIIRFKGVKNIYAFRDESLFFTGTVSDFQDGVSFLCQYSFTLSIGIDRPGQTA